MLHNHPTPPGDGAPRESGWSLRDSLNVLFRHKWKMLICFVVTVTLLILFILTLPHFYRSEARLMLRVGRENASTDPSVVGPTIGVTQNRETEVNTEVAILSNRYCLEQVVDRLGVDSILTGLAGSGPSLKDRLIKMLPWLSQDQQDSAVLLRDRAIKFLGSHLKVDAEQKTSIINVQLDGRDPKLTQAALATLLEVYLQQHIKAFRSQASPEFFQDQTNSLRQSLQQKEDELEAYRRQHGIIEADHQLQVLISRLDYLRGQMQDTDSKANAAQAQITELTQLLKSRKEQREISHVTGKPNMTADNLKTQLATLRIREKELETRYPNEDRNIDSVRSQIKSLEQQLARETDTLTEITTGIDENYRSLELQKQLAQAQYKSLQAQRQALAEALTQTQSAADDLSRRAVDVARLEREVKALESEYMQYRDNQQRVNILTALDRDLVSNVTLIAPASFSPLPVKPQRTQLGVLALFLGLCASLALGVLAEAMDDSLKTNAEVANRLGLPVLLSVTREEYRQCN